MSEDKSGEKITKGEALAILDQIQIPVSFGSATVNLNEYAGYMQQQIEQARERLNKIIVLTYHPPKEEQT